MTDRIRVAVWNEYRHEKKDAAVAALYPEGIQAQIASFLSASPDIETRTAYDDLRVRQTFLA